MSKSARCEECSCEFAPSVDGRGLLLKRSAEEVRYGTLWAEVELPRLLSDRRLNKKGDKQK
jgi:hypothetical protein